MLGIVYCHSFPGSVTSIPKPVKALLFYLALIFETVRSITIIEKINWDLGPAFG